MGLTGDKKQLRERLSALREGVSEGDHKSWSGIICTKLQELVIKRKTGCVHVFLPMGMEVNLYPFIEWLLKSKIQVVVPKTLTNRRLEHLVLKSLDELTEGVYGTRHPSDELVYDGRLDLIVVPGLGFDAAGSRLGYGGGYYDGFLVQHPKAYKVGVGFSFQMIDQVPMEAHDIKVDAVITD